MRDENYHIEEQLNYKYQKEIRVLKEKHKSILLREKEK